MQALGGRASRKFCIKSVPKLLAFRFIQHLDEYSSSNTLCMHACVYVHVNHIHAFNLQICAALDAAVTFFLGMQLNAMHIFVQV